MLPPDFGEVAFVDGDANGLRVVVENAFDEREVTDRRCHQNIGLGTARDEESHYVMPIEFLPLHVLPGGSYVLCASRFMIDVASVDIGTVVEQQRGNLDALLERLAFLGVD